MQTACSTCQMPCYLAVRYPDRITLHYCDSLSLQAVTALYAHPQRPNLDWHRPEGAQNLALSVLADFLERSGAPITGALEACALFAEAMVPDAGEAGAWLLEEARVANWMAFHNMLTRGGI